VLLKEKIKLNPRNPDMRDEAVLGFKLRDASFGMARSTFKSSVDDALADEQVPPRSFAFFGAQNRVLVRKWLDELSVSYAGSMQVFEVTIQIPVPEISSLGLAGANTDIETVSDILDSFSMFSRLIFNPTSADLDQR
jgi:hypothetical protein